MQQFILEGLLHTVSFLRLVLLMILSSTAEVRLEALLHRSFRTWSLLTNPWTVLAWNFYSSRPLLCVAFTLHNMNWDLYAK